MKKAILIMALLSPGVAMAAHPFLIVTTNSYTAMVSSSTSSPWSDMKEAAEDLLAGEFGTYGQRNGSSMPAAQDRENQMIELMGANALLYALNQVNSSSITYRNNIKGMLNAWPALWAQEQGDPTAYSANSPLNGAFFASVIALDVIHPDLTAGERTTYETEFSSYISWNNSHVSSWQLANYGANAIWSVYLSSSAAYVLSTTTTYRNGLLYPGDLSQLNVGGGFAEGSLYAWSRIGGASNEKLAKWGWPYVAEFTGVSDYFSDTAMQTAMESLFSFYTNPFNWRVPIGDTNNDYLLGDDYWYGVANASYTLTTTDLAVGNYSARAAALSSRLISLAPKTVKYPSDILSYAMTTGPLVASLPTVSVAYPYLGAAFWDEDQSTSALMGVLYNAKQTRWDHLHREQNTLYLAGYGETLLSGSGYFFGGTILGFPNSWSHDNAVSANVVLIGNQNHSTNLKADGVHPTTGGDGILESVIGPYFDYASGYSTTSYAGMGQHTRNFLFIHPADGANGYWVSLDEINSSTYPSVNVLWHPYSTNPSTTTAATEWAWSISDRNVSTTTLNVFLGTPATSITFSSGVFQGKYGSNAYGTYLNALYNVDVSSNVRAATVLYPSNSTHAKATMAQIAPSGATGASITSGSIVDYVLISSPSADVTHAGATYKGRASFFRKNGSSLSSYFVRQGTKFDSGDSIRKGYDSNAPASVYFRGTTGVMTSTGTAVTFYYPGISGVSFDGLAAAGTDHGDSFTTTAASGDLDVSLNINRSQIRGSATLRGGVTVR